MGSELTTTLYADGVEVVDGSVEAVALYEKLLREAWEKMQEARVVLSRVPDEVEHGWRKRQVKAERPLDTLIGTVSRFAADFQRNGIDAALEDAKFRREV